MVSLGGFSFEVTVDNSQALASLTAVQRQAEQLYASLQAGSKASVTINTDAAQKALADLEAKAKKLQTQGSVSLSIKTDTADSQARIGSLTEAARALGALPAVNLQFRADSSQATAALASLQSSLTRARAGERVNLQITGNAAQAEAALSKLAADIRAAEARGVHIAVQVDTKPAESALQKFGASVAQGLGIGTGASIAVGAINAIKTGLENSIGAGIAYNAQLETASRTFELFTGSAAKAQEALKILRTYADFTPFDTAEVIQSGQAFIGVVNGDIAAMERLVHLSGQLAATNPLEGFVGATRAIREVLGGQTTSIADRFNIPLSTIQALKDLGLSGEELAAALVKAAHGSEELVEILSTTATGRLSNFQSALANLGKTATEPLFEELSKTLDTLNTNLVKNSTAWDAWAKSIGKAIGDEVKTSIAVIAALVDLINLVNNALAEFRRMNPLVQMGREFQQAAESGPVGGLLFGRGFLGFGAPSRFAGQNDSAGPGEPPSRASAARLLTASGATGGARPTGPSPEQLKADAEKQAKELKEINDDLTRHALQNLDDQISRERRIAADRKDQIESVRDAAIRAADDTRDASLRALDDEAQARDRARTIQDRAIEDSQAATLDALEQAHDATIRGLEEQSSAIQKRHDETVKGLDDEIAAVDRKRDAALRAIDEETRAESRRHSEALSNIDAERDRKLGEVDAQLAAIDAAAQADQRRQTDQSLARSLSDARRQLRSADTPEEAARARRAISDAEAAIQRERVNRRREDARDRLRDQADQIREAADTAKKIETARNSATTGALSERQRVANEQAQADTARIQAVQKRVEEETKIELAAIAERTKAETISYDQAVKSAQESFTQQGRALADARVEEDRQLAERKRVVQDTYDTAKRAATDAATTQITELNRATQATIADLELQKRAWREWQEAVQDAIRKADLANLPPQPPSLRAGENAGAGTGEPPSRGAIPTSTTSTAPTATPAVARVAPRGPQFGIEDASQYLINKGWIDGSQEFFDAVDRMFELQRQGIPPPLDMIITGHALGGFARAGRMAMFGERGMEFGLPPQAGSVLPADVSRNLLAVAAGQSSGGTSLSIGNLTVTVPPGTTDPSGYAREIVRTVFTIIDAAERGSANPAPATLGGA